MNKRIIAAVMVAAIGMTTTACKQGSEGFAASGSTGLSGGSEQNDASGVEGIKDVDTAALDADLDSMEKSMADVQKEISDISILALSGNGVQSKSLDDGIRKVFDGLIKGVDVVKAKAADLRSKVNVNLAKLDPLNPLHIALVMKMQDILGYLDRLDAEISNAIGKIVSLVDEKVASLDKAVAKLDPKNPLSIVAMIYWAKLKVVIVECNAQLAAKI